MRIAPHAAEPATSAGAGEPLPAELVELEAHVRALPPAFRGALEPVVEVRGLEREQVDPSGDVEHPIEGAPAHELAEHAALLVLDRLREVERDGDGDERREHSPLIAANDAVPVDTTTLDLEGVLGQILTLVVEAKEIEA